MLPQIELIECNLTLYKERTEIHMDFINVKYDKIHPDLTIMKMK